MTDTVTLDSGLQKSIIGAVNANMEKQIAFTQELVRFPSVRGREKSAQDFLYQQMADRGLSMDRWALEISDIESHPGFSPVSVDYNNAINVVGTHRPEKEQGRSLILNGHIDVVPVGPLDMWA